MATVTRNPTSDDVFSGTWDGTPGSRYTLVDDHPDAGGADVLTHGTANPGMGTFGFSVFTIPAGSTGISVQVIYYDRKNASQACNIGGRLKVGGSYFNVASHNPANGVLTLRTDNWATNPKTAAAWTVDDVNGVGANGLQAFGWFSTDANPSISLASVIVQVTYTAPAVTLAGVAAGVATVAGAVAVARRLAAVSNGVAAVAGAVAVARRLAGSSAGVATVAGALAVARPLAGGSAGVGTVAGALAVARPLAAASTGVASVTGALTVGAAGVMLAGVSAGAAAVLGALAVQRPLAAASGGVATVAGALTVVAGLPDWRLRTGRSLS